MSRVIKVKTNRFSAGRKLDIVIVEAVSFCFFFQTKISKLCGH